MIRKDSRRMGRWRALSKRMGPQGGDIEFPVGQTRVDLHPAGVIRFAQPRDRHPLFLLGRGPGFIICHY